jgi:hypothetical protein
MTGPITAHLKYIVRADWLDACSEFSCRFSVEWKTTTPQELNENTIPQEVNENIRKMMDNNFINMRQTERNKKKLTWRQVLRDFDFNDFFKVFPIKPYNK